MARFMLTAMPFTGHVTPLRAVAEPRWSSRGHDVRVYTGGAFRDRVESTGAQARAVAGRARFRRERPLGDIPAPGRQEGHRVSCSSTSRTCSSRPRPRRSKI